jgi:hypothetical protein
MAGPAGTATSRYVVGIDFGTTYVSTANDSMLPESTLLIASGIAGSRLPLSLIHRPPTT